MSQRSFCRPAFIGLLCTFLFLCLCFGAAAENVLHFPASLTEIEAEAFSGMTEVEELDFPGGLEQIGSQAFEGCTGLNEVVLPDQLSKIGSGAFSDCANLKSALIPKSVQTIGENAFNGCSGDFVILGYSGTRAESYASENSIPFVDLTSFLWEDLGDGKYAVTGYTGAYTSITIPSVLPNGHRVYQVGNGREPFESEAQLTHVTLSRGIELIGSHAFEEYGYLTGVNIPGSVVEIGRCAFAATNLQSVVIPNSVTSMGGGVFKECRSLTEVQLSNRQNSISGEMFYNCESLLHVSIPGSVTSIGSYAFYSCSDLTEIDIPSSVQSIGVHAFRGCIVLREVSLHEGLKIIDSKAFDSCRSLTNLVIPGSVTQITDNIAVRCQNLTAIDVSAQNTDYQSVDGVLYTKDASGATLIACPGGKNSVTVPGNVRLIGYGAFEDCRNLTRVTLPGSMTGIESHAFVSCVSLEEMILPDAITYISHDAFSGCSSLSRVHLPAGLKDLGEKAFSGCRRLDGVTLPNGLESIGALAFSGCDSLTEIVIPPSVAVLSSGVFQSCNRLSDVVLSSVQTIESNAFADCTSLEEIVLPDTVSVLGSAAFAGCSSLTKITLSESLSEIQEYTFYSDLALQSIRIPENVTYIADRAFDPDGFSHLIMYGYTDSCARQYAQQHGIVFVALNESQDFVFSVDEDDVCTLIQYTGSESHVTIPEEDGAGHAVTCIGENAFAGCAQVVGVMIPDTVLQISETAFSGTASDLTIYGYTGTAAETFAEQYALRFVPIMPDSTPVSDFTYEDNGDGTCTLVSYQGSATTLNLPTTDEDGNLLTVIGEEAFLDHEELTRLILPGTVNRVESFAFSGCTALSSIVIPDNVQDIAEDAFDELSENLIIYGYEGSYAQWYAQMQNISFALLQLPRMFHFEDLGDGTCKLTGYLGSDTELVLPETSDEGLPVAAIGEGAFAYNTHLTRILLPESCVRIENGAFRGCSALTGIVLTANVQELGPEAFAGCPEEMILYGYEGTYAEAYAESLRLRFVSMDPTTTPMYCFSFENNGDGTCTLARYSGYGFEQVSVPRHSGDGLLVSRIGDEAFARVRDVTDIVLPDSVTSIGSYAFGSCSLTSIILPSGLTEIGDRIFSDCSDLEEVSLPEQVTAIGEEAFYTCSSLTSVAFPENLTRIGNKAFYGCSSLTSVVFPEALEELGESAFYGCSSLASVTLPEPLEEMGDSAFCGCTSLTELALPDGMTEIPTSAFKNNTALTSLNIPDTVVTIGVESFSGCTSLANLEFSASLKEICDRAFADCTSLTVVTLPSGMEELRGGAFQNCTSLETVTLPAGLYTISSWTFQGCTGLTAFTIPAEVRYVFEEAFAECENLSEVHIADTVISIVSDAFRDCSSELTIYGNSGTYAQTFAERNGYTFVSINPQDEVFTYLDHCNGTAAITGFRDQNTSASLVIPEQLNNGLLIVDIASWAFYSHDELTSVTLPETLKGIGEYAFAWCQGLTEISIPAGVDWIHPDAFENCSSLSAIHVMQGNPQYRSTDGVLYSADGTELLICPANRTALAVPAGVTTISATFAGCDHLSAVIVPESVTSISWISTNSCSKDLVMYGYSGSYAETYAQSTGIPFEEIGGMTYADRQDGSCAIASYAGSRTELLLPPCSPDGMPVSAIGAEAFRGNTNLVRVEIPDTVSTIESQAFSGCSALTAVVIPSSVTSIAPDSFSGCSGDLAIHGIADSCAETFALDHGIRFVDITPTTPESAFSFYENGDGTCSVGNYSGSDEMIIIPSHRSSTGSVVTSIRDYTFYQKPCVSVRIPNTVLSIGGYAFWECTELTEVTLPSGLTTIGDYAFYSCSALSTLEIPQTVTQIGSSAFSGCTSLSGINLPENLTEISGGLFGGCDSLHSIVLPDSITSIGSSAFIGCDSLTDITIPNTVVSIGDSAFYECTGLTEILIPDSVTTLGSYVFYGCTGLTQVTLSNSLTAIDSDAFSRCSSLADISLPMGITAIGNSAFYECTGLSAMVLPESVNTIGYNAFYGCTGLVSLVLPEQAESIGGSAFEDCTGLTEVTIPEGITELEGNVFSDCTGLTRVTIPASVTSIGMWTFARCSSLRQILGHNGTYAQTYALENGYEFVDLDAQEEPSYGVTWTYDENTHTLTFSGQGEMLDGEEDRPDWYDYKDTAQNVVIGDGITNVGNCNFRYFTALRNVTIPDSVLQIGWSAFEGCTSLTSVQLPERLTSIDDYAFEECAMLTSVTLPATLEYIGDLAFGLTGLTSIAVEGDARIEDFFYEIYSDGQWNNYLFHIPVTADANVYDTAFYGVPMPSVAPYMLEAAGTAIAAGQLDGLEAEFVWIPDNIESIALGAFTNANIQYLFIPNLDCSIAPGAIPASVKILAGGYSSNLASYCETNGNEHLWLVYPFGGNG